MSLAPTLLYMYKSDVLAAQIIRVSPTSFTSNPTKGYTLLDYNWIWYFIGLVM